MDYIMTTDGLTKMYGEKAAAKDINIHIRPGAVYGLIGRNGAGKTTVMRMLSGLSTPTKGSFSMFGKNGKDALKEMRNVGVLIEHPGIYPNLSAFKNLKIKAIAMGCDNRKGYIDELLELVGLENVKNKKAGSFSLGMRQRLGIALALIGDPKLIILDELSKLAASYGIIHEGKLTDEFTVEELHKRCGRYIELSTDDNKAAAEVIRRAGFDKVSVDDDNILRVGERLDEVKSVVKLLVDNNLVPDRVGVKDVSLEDYYLSVTGGEHNG